ncbi:MAG: galactitol system component [Verrucomicrobiota bacterium]|jgi:PTS system galactitol-specific IIB component|nr:galactitol system component [Verrucomicrobiota bacterium]MDK2964213.1 galactitol system component [Verrucomicrobiota bacterium]
MMKGKKRILVACGTAIATSTVVARKIEEELTKRGIDVVITQCKAAEVPSKVDGQDLVVTTTFVSGTGNVPVIHTVSFLTGIGMEQDIEKIVEYLK